MEENISLRMERLMTLREENDRLRAVRALQGEVSMDKYAEEWITEAMVWLKETSAENDALRKENAELRGENARLLVNNAGLRLFIAEEIEKLREEVAELRKRYRNCVIRLCGDEVFCDCCDRFWRDGEPENHAPDCLARGEK